MSDGLPFAREITPAQPGDKTVSLTYSERLLRRKVLCSDDGLRFLVDLPSARDVRPGEAFSLSDGRRVAVIAAEQELIEVRGDLPRFAWHIGNRHTPCQIEGDRLLIAADHVLEDMLRKLGAQLRPLKAPFAPEGGAYGHGRTMGHSHP